MVGVINGEIFVPKLALTRPQRRVKDWQSGATTGTVDPSIDQSCWL